MKRLSDIYCIFRIHLVRLRAESGPFLLAAIVFPVGMYLFANGVFRQDPGEVTPNAVKLHFVAASIVFSLSLTAISWFGYLLLENRFTGRLKLFATLPVASSSYILGVLVFALGQGIVACFSLLVCARLLGVDITIDGWRSVFLMVIVVLIAILSLAGLSVVLAHRVRSFASGSLMTDGLGGGLVLLAPIYYPVETLPVALQWLSKVLPTTYIFQAFNKILSGDLIIGSELIVLCAMATVTLLIGFWQMSWREA